MKFVYSPLKTLICKITCSVFLLFLGVSVNAQTIWSNSIDGTNPNTANPFVTGNVTDPDVTVSGIGRGTGINGSNANNRYNASNWSTGTTLDATDYFEFTITPN